MKLKNIEFGNVFNASGARNFFGEHNAWWWHRFWSRFGLNWNGATFISKTTTFESRPGNMPLTNALQPQELFPKCIKVNFRKGAVLNAVGLSGPGLLPLLYADKWNERKEPFLISFMAVDNDRWYRLDNVERFCLSLQEFFHFYSFKTPIGIEFNLSCPNAGLDPSELINEAIDALNIFQKTLPNIPVVLKFNALVPVDAVRNIATHPHCSAVTISNTIPWGKLPDKIDWPNLFGTSSPLAKMGGGGLSGSPIFPIVKEWITQAQNFPKPLVIGGGIMSVNDALTLLELGASAIQLGSVAILRPWRVARIIRAVNSYFMNGVKK